MGVARTFDITIVTKGEAEYTFNAVNRDEHEGMDTYLKAKKVRVTSKMADDAELMAELGEDDDDSDAEMQSVRSSESDEPVVRRGGDVDEEDSEEGNIIYLRPLLVSIFT